ncbi:MAG: protein kinase domain-containing protein [Nannocystaceae bacterium]|nr:serine/threonine-protein kinase [bacterium]
MSEPPQTLGPETLGSDTLGPETVGPEAPTSEPTPGQRLGRFIIERRLGAGAMGVVVLAHDPELERPVAIKLLKSDGDDARARLRREAQAVAKIQHPNVIAVHEVGTHGDQVYVVMEFVDGGTLRDWVKVKPRGWQDILGVYRQAGLGLIAAHQASLVHRDFKPDNVLIGRDGRVRVTDFGIVGISGGSTGVTQSDPNLPIDDASARLTTTGAIVGTPAYMPPEQYAAGAADARSDQFAFCVSLYEALFGVRPHAGDTIGSILYAVQSGAVRPVPPTDVPAPIVQAVLRGLRPDPAKRHPSMHALLGALWPKARTPVWPIAAACLGVVALGAVGYAFLRPNDAQPEPSPTPEVASVVECIDAAATFAAVWNDERRAAAKAAFERYGATEAAAFVKVATALDAREQAWTWGSDAACAARRSGEQDEATDASRAECLDHALRATDTFVALLAEGSREAVDGAVSSVTMLPRVEQCADEEALDAWVQPTPDQRDGVLALEKDLIMARSLLVAGKHHETVALARSLESRARKVGHAATTAAVLEMLARGSMQVGELDEAEAQAREAATLAAAGGDPDVGARSFGTLIFVVGAYIGRPQEALGMLQTGRDVFARSRDPRSRSYFKAAEASVLGATGDLGGAEAALRECIELLEGVEPTPPDELAVAYSSRAAVAMGRGDAAAAREHQQTALSVAEEGLGKKHALYGSIAMSLGQSHLGAAEHEEALKWFEASLSALEHSVGRDHSTCALALTQIGNAQMVLKRYDEAAKSLAEALRRLDASGQQDPNTRLALHKNIAQLAFFRGDFEEARTHYVSAGALIREHMGSTNADAALMDRAAAAMHQARGDDEEALAGYRDAKAALVQALGPKHQQVAMAAAFVADALQRLGRCAEASGEYAETFQIYGDLSLPPDATLAQAVAGQGVCELTLGKAEAGETSLGRAAEMLEQLGLDGEIAAAVKFAAAKGHLASGDRPGADERSATAEAIYARLGPGWARPLADVRRWRAKAGL